MLWIKRNLFFVIGSLVALALMAGAGVYSYWQWEHDVTVREDLDKGYAELDRLYTLPLGPGTEKVNNIKAAEEQQVQIGAFIGRARKFFARIPANPDSAKVSDKDFSDALSLTIDKLQRYAASASVALPPKYNFSFTAQSDKVRFQGRVEPLAAQLGEVKAICDILFQARINALDSVQRERVSPDDLSGAQTDYLDEHSVTNELAMLTPYRITFRCFSAELAAVLAGFASSPSALIVKGINVELAPTAAAATPEAPALTGVAAPVTVTRPTAAESHAGMVYIPETGQWHPAYGPPPGATAPPGRPAPVTSVPTAPTPGQLRPTAAAAAGSGGLKVWLDEKALRVTMLIYVVKLLPQK